MEARPHSYCLRSSVQGLEGSRRARRCADRLHHFLRHRTGYVGRETTDAADGRWVFRADQSMNGGGVAELRTYNAEIDRLAGQRRPSALAHFPAALPPPSRRHNVR